MRDVAVFVNYHMDDIDAGGDLPGPAVAAKFGQAAGGSAAVTRHCFCAMEGNGTYVTLSEGLRMESCWITG